MVCLPGSDWSGKEQKELGFEADSRSKTHLEEKEGTLFGPLGQGTAWSSDKDELAGGGKREVKGTYSKKRRRGEGGIGRGGRGGNN